ncbi:MAG TPA: hypothetical protein EYP48_01260 [Ignisphaera sp.]|nr:hypothetical protein [Ignisphaera sp.]
MCHKIGREPINIMSGIGYYGVNALLKKAFCELFIARSASSIRLAIAMELVTTFGVSQSKAAKLAGIPQPLLNYVLRGKRSVFGLNEIYKSKEAVNVIREVAKELLSGRILYLCDVCFRLRQRKALLVDENHTEEECVQMLTNLALKESMHECMLREYTK